MPLHFQIQEGILFLVMFSCSDLQKKQAPKYWVKIGDSYILWFESSNQYIIASESLKTLMDVFMNTNCAEEFTEQLNTYSNFEPEKSKAYFDELKKFFESANSSIKNDSVEDIGVTLKMHNEITHHYDFGGISIKVEYGSKAIKNLIHPQWAHAESHNITPPSVVFNFFTEDASFFLFKNQNYIGHYSLNDFHLLQGQFALQLINQLYTKEEADWIATFHASTVCDDQEAIMLIGDSGNGKSTLSAVLMAHGVDVLADDFTPIAADNSEVFRFPSGISVKKGAFEMLRPLYPELEQYELYQSASKNVKLKYIPPKNDFATSIPHLPCRKIVLVKYESAVQSLITPLDTEKILPILITESWLSPLAANAKRFLNWLQDLECFELHYSDNDFAISEIKALFNS